MKRSILTLFLLISSVSLAFGESAAAIKQRMAERLPTILEMKDSLAVGESNQAYLTILGDVSEPQAVIIQSENADRKTIYTMLANQTGASLDLVLSKRAEQLRNQAKPGTKIQQPTGEWIVKN